mmetsp:Transcript_9299/g.27609  ORF Transcript_9299/g.27609 Transcript_9299/m.27609 type:complete len:231 (-) Transcript_9299:403-1095(-)
MVRPARRDVSACSWLVVRSAGACLAHAIASSTQKRRLRSQSTGDLASAGGLWDSALRGKPKPRCLPAAKATAASASQSPGTLCWARRSAMALAVSTMSGTLRGPLLFFPFLPGGQLTFFLEGSVSASVGTGRWIMAATSAPSASTAVGLFWRLRLLRCALAATAWASFSAPASGSSASTRVSSVSVLAVLTYLASTVASVSETLTLLSTSVLSLFMEKMASIKLAPELSG